MNPWDLLVKVVNLAGKPLFMVWGATLVAALMPDGVIGPALAVVRQHNRAWADGPAWLVSALVAFALLYEGGRAGLAWLGRWRVGRDAAAQRQQAEAERDRQRQEQSARAPVLIEGLCTLSPDEKHLLGTYLERNMTTLDYSKHSATAQRLAERGYLSVVEEHGLTTSYEINWGVLDHIRGNPGAVDFEDRPRQQGY